MIERFQSVIPNFSPHYKQMSPMFAKYLFKFLSKVVGGPIFPYLEAIVSRELSLLLLVHLDDINFTHRFPYSSSTSVLVMLLIWIWMMWGNVKRWQQSLEASLHLRYVCLLALVNTMLILYVSSLTVLISKNNFRLVCQGMAWKVYDWRATWW